MTRPRTLAVTIIAIAVALAACGSGGSSGKSSSTTSGPGVTESTHQQTTELGTGVTDSQIKIGVSLVDFDCIKNFVDQIRVNQDQIYNAFIDNINQHGGIAGRKIVPVYHTFCPIGAAGALTLCTQFSEDDKVFAVIGNFVDFSGDAQTCLAKRHKTIIITFQLTQAIMNQSPPGLIILPGITSERSTRVLLSLLQTQHVLDGKKVAILGETVSQPTVKSTVEPGLKAMNVPMGSTAILQISGSDTTIAQSQLDSFIERWKNEGVNALFITGTQVSSKQFVEKIRAQMPDVMLMSDDQQTNTYGQEEKQAGKKPNPYEGIYVPTGPSHAQYDASENWKHCADIYKTETGKDAPNAEAVVPGPDGKTLDTYGGINDACQITGFLYQIGSKVGRFLNPENWQAAVDNYGPIVDYGSGIYASLHQGKYDDQDTWSLGQFDSSIGKGDFKQLTPLRNIPASS